MTFFDPTLLGIALAVICGGVVGFALALTGAGGSTLAVPLLLYVVGFDDPHLAIGTSALAVSVNAYANLVPHTHAGHVRWRIALVFTAAGVAGAFAGSEFGKWVDGRDLIGLFAILVLIISVVMIVPRRSSSLSTQSMSHGQLGARLTGTGLGTGTLAGFFGIGGGFLIVPGLMLSARLEILEAIGTSLFGVGSFGLATALNYARSGLIDWPVAAEFILGGVVGGVLGVRTARQLAARRGVLNKVFAAVIFAVGVYMLIRTYA